MTISFHSSKSPPEGDEEKLKLHICILYLHCLCYFKIILMVGLVTTGMLIRQLKQVYGLQAVDLVQSAITKHKSQTISPQVRNRGIFKYVCYDQGNPSYFLKSTCYYLPDPHPTKRLRCSKVLRVSCLDVMHLLT